MGGLRKQATHRWMSVNCDASLIGHYSSAKPRHYASMRGERRRRQATLGVFQSIHDTSAYQRPRNRDPSDLLVCSKSIGFFVLLLRMRGQACRVALIYPLSNAPYVLPKKHRGISKAQPKSAVNTIKRPDLIRGVDRSMYVDVVVSL